MDEKRNFPQVNMIEVKIPESKPHGGQYNITSCPICEKLAEIYKKDLAQRNRRRHYREFDKDRDSER